MVKNRFFFGFSILTTLLILTILSSPGYYAQETYFVENIDLHMTTVQDIPIDTGPRYENLTEYSPIYISSNFGFLTHASSGNGTENNPYIIEGLNITTSSIPLVISYTTSYVIIRDCIFSGLGSGDYGINIRYAENLVIEFTEVKNTEYHGINVENSESVMIKNTELYNNAGWAGIYAGSSTDIMIHENNVHDTDGNGIMTQTSQNIHIFGNYAHNNAYPGIRFQSTSDTIASENIVYSNNEEGIWAFEDNTNISIISNSVYENAGSGINLRQSDYSKIINNNITGNGIHGISLEDSHENKIDNNTITGNQYQSIDYWEGSPSNGNLIYSNTIIGNERGIYIRGTDNIVQDNAIIESSDWAIYVYKSANTISGNLIYLNAKGVFFDADSDSNSFTDNSIIRNYEQIVDYGSSNNIDSNYYDDQRVDSDNDGVVDNPYEIYDDAGLSNQDDHPQTTPQHNHPANYLGDPFLLTSIPLSITGTFEISWLPSNYAGDLVPQYTLYIDNSTTTLYIISNKSETSFSWDTTIYPNGDYMLNMEVITETYMISKYLGLVSIENIPNTSGNSTSDTGPGTQLSISPLGIASALVLLGYQSYRSKNKRYSGR